MNSNSMFTFGASLLMLAGSFVSANTLTNIAVFPPEVNIQTNRGMQRVLVQASFDDGITEDVTSKAKITISDPKVAKLENGIVRPVADGKCTIDVSYEGKTTKIPLDVKQAQADRPISFKLDVMPIFMRTGCNQGGCHGAARGKDGFRLSLFGFDPDGDHYRLTRELNGRRINLAIPEESLLVEKGAGKVPHTGGQKFAVGDQYFNEIIRWLDAGAPVDSASIATPLSIDVYPNKVVMNGKGSTQQIVVRAKYSDGSERDVTSLSLFMSNNDSSAKISPDGLVTAGDRGEAFIMARFHTFTVGSQFIVLPKDLKFNFPQSQEKNYIDTLVNAKLKNLRITPSEVCSDEAFLRRVYVDLNGILPTVEEFQKFMANKAPNKREQLVEELLAKKRIRGNVGSQMGRTFANPQFQRRQLQIHFALLQLVAGSYCP